MSRYHIDIVEDGMFEHVAKMSRVSNPAMSHRPANGRPPVRFRRLTVTEADLESSMLQLLSFTQEETFELYSYPEPLDSNSSINCMSRNQGNLGNKSLADEVKIEQHRNEQRRQHLLHNMQSSAAGMRYGRSMRAAPRCLSECDMSASKSPRRNQNLMEQMVDQRQYHEEKSVFKQVARKLVNEALLEHNIDAHNQRGKDWPQWNMFDDSFMLAVGNQPDSDRKRLQSNSALADFSSTDLCDMSRAIGTPYHETAWQLDKHVFTQNRESLLQAIRDEFKSLNSEG